MQCCPKAAPMANAASDTVLLKPRLKRALSCTPHRGTGVRRGCVVGWIAHDARETDHGLLTAAARVGRRRKEHFVNPTQRGGTVGNGPRCAVGVGDANEAAGRNGALGMMHAEAQRAQSLGQRARAAEFLVSNKHHGVPRLHRGEGRQ